jgi:hypothetical protein
MANRVDCEDRWSSPRYVKSGAFGTGSWTDTSPHVGCCAATEVAGQELAANAAAYDFALTVEPAHLSVVPEWELVDFVGRQAAPAYLPLNQN